jgi:hypothetical protein
MILREARPIGGDVFAKSSVLRQQQEDRPPHLSLRMIFG